MTGRHVALLVEDDESIARVLIQILASIGFDAIHVTTREAALAEIARRSFCLVLFDMQLPDAPGSVALVTTGLTLLKKDLRGAFPGRNEADKHRVQAIAVTGHSGKPDFVTRVMQEGADDFILKPFDEDLTAVADKVHRCLRHSGRIDHAQCGGITQLATHGTLPPPPLTEPSSARERLTQIRLTGRVARRRFDILVDGEAASLPEAALAVLLRFEAARVASPPGWVHVSDLAATDADAHKLISRLRSELRPFLRKTRGELLVNDRGQYRLDERIAIDVDEALEGTDAGAIAALARAIRGTERSPGPTKAARAKGPTSKRSG
jgi:CheY-like chemotaxis protein